jgi:hypothetical protein
MSVFPGGIPHLAAKLAIALVVGSTVFPIRGQCQESDAPRQPGVITRFAVQAADEATDAQIADTAAILTRRFSEVGRTPTSTVVPTISGRRIEIEFRGDAVALHEAQFLLAPGVLRVAAVTAPLQMWFSDRDIQEAGAFQNESTRIWVIGIQLRKRAAERLDMLSTRNIGGVIDWKLDGKLLSRAQLRGRIPDGHLVLELESLEQAVLLEVLLKHGRLPVGVSNFEILRRVSR